MLRHKAIVLLDVIAELLPASSFGVTSSGSGAEITSLQNTKIKSLYSRYYAEACNEWWGPSPRLSAWTTQLRRNIAAVASR